MIKKRRQIEGFELWLTMLGGLVLLFILAPLVNMLIHSSPDSLSKALHDREVTDSIWLTLATSMAATVVMAFGAVPLSFLLPRRNINLIRLVLGLTHLPVVFPHSSTGIAILGIISRQSLPGKAAGALGFDLVGHPAGIMVAMAFVSLPFLINAARDGFAEVPERLEHAAQNLGAKPRQVFFRITLPLAWRSILSGLIMMFARGMSEFGAVVIIAYHPMITPVLIYERFGAFGLNYARPVAVIFVGICLLFFVLLRMLVKERSRYVRS